VSRIEEQMKWILPNPAVPYPEVFLGESTRCIFVNYILDLRVRKYFRGEQLFESTGS
jgi:hypothetical protein